MYEIYGKDNCKFCKSAVTLLESKGLPFTYYKIEVDIPISELKSLVEVAIGSTPTSVPQIFNRGYYVGGFDELNNSLN